MLKMVASYSDICVKSVVINCLLALNQSDVDNEAIQNNREKMRKDFCSKTLESYALE